MIGFQCHTCGEFHKGIPTFGWEYPIQYLEVAEQERPLRCVLTSDTCVIDEKWFFVRGCIEIPVHRIDDPFIWGAWVSLSPKSFQRFVALEEAEERVNEEPFFGWLCAHIRIYPDTLNLKTMVHLRNGGLRPFFELEPTDHPLAVEQREGISMDRVAEIYEAMVHGKSDAV
jgi:hypothetical protein